MVCSQNNIWVIIPAYNEEYVISDVIENLRKIQPHYQIVIIDDGSVDNTYQIASKLPVHVLRHPVNLGQGAALATGVQYALMQDASLIIHFDADGQMRPEEIPLFVKEIDENHIDVVLGSRFLGIKSKEMTQIKKFILKCATIFTRLTTGLKITDTHNGFRAFSAKAARSINITQNKMAHASEILSEISKHKLTYKEVPVTIRYTDYSKSKGQSIFNSINILFELLTGEKHG